MKLAELEKICKNTDYEIFQDDILMQNASIGAAHYKIDIAHCTPTFILKVDETYMALIIQGNRKIDFKKIKQFFATRKVRMATPEEILKVTGATVGSVSMINQGLKTFIDEGVTALDCCYGGCGIDKMTLKIKANQLIQLTQAEIGDFSMGR